MEIKKIRREETSSFYPAAAMDGIAGFRKKVIYPILGPARA